VKILNYLNRKVLKASAWLTAVLGIGSVFLDHFDPKSWTVYMPFLFLGLIIFLFGCLIISQ